MHINKAGLDIIKEFEGFRSKAYHCPAGVLTIGYGHTSRAGEPKVTPGMWIDEKQASEILANDVVKYEDYVKDTLGDAINNINANQFSACVSLCYNIGPSAFDRSSTARAIKNNRLDVAANKILLWNKSNGRTLRGLVRRRKAERELFLS